MLKQLKKQTKPNMSNEIQEDWEEKVSQLISNAKANAANTTEKIQKDTSEGVMKEMEEEYKSKQKNYADWNLSENDFGPLWEYVNDPNVTDINFNHNGTALWITDLNKGKYKISQQVLDQKLNKWYETLDNLERDNNKSKNLVFVEQFAQRVSNKESKGFNKHNPLLEAETDELRISIVHRTVAASGYSICLRKTPKIARITPQKAINENYCSRELLNLFINCVKAKMNFVVCGEPGVGKTEWAKFLSQFIRAEDRVITIEDSLELHYADINPGKDCVELKIDEPDFTYSKAIKACLRQNPQWIMLSEARSTEVKYLLESWSTGVCGITTLHTDDVRKIPDRIQNMMGDSRDAERLENDIFSFVNVGVLIRKKPDKNGKIYRYVDQVCFFNREQNKNSTLMLVEDGNLLTNDPKLLPKNIQKKMIFAGIDNPFKLTK